MKVFVDTSAIYAVVSESDENHEQAAGLYRELLSSGAHLVTSSYVQLESLALSQARLGVPVARTVQDALEAAFKVVWVDAVLHRKSWERLVAANRRGLSLVDCSSFEVMDSLSLRKVFAFDPHFQDAGFEPLAWH